MVESDGNLLRATDHKTGRAHPSRELRIGGGQVLQPVLYALALAKLLPARRVHSGRLFFCTSRGEFQQREVLLDDDATRAAEQLAQSLQSALAAPFLPAAPEPGACESCEYRPICGPHEEQRTLRKNRRDLSSLLQLREQP